MDQLKIAKFIADCRKQQGLTQLQLAEKLNITDRAVSKWETGKSLPDSSIMLELCDILNISVTDLLHGEVVIMKEHNTKAEETLVELIREKQEKDRYLLMFEWVIGILSVIVLFVPILLGALLPMEDWQRILTVFSGFIPAFIGFSFALKIEQIAGYYVCKHCGHHYVPTFHAINFAPHMGRTRYMRCPKCQQKSWQRKVLSKDD